MQKQPGNLWADWEALGGWASVHHMLAAQPPSSPLPPSQTPCQSCWPCCQIKISQGAETVRASGFGIAIYCSLVCDQWYYYHIHQTVQEKVQNLFKLSSSDGKGTIKPVLVQEMSARKYETLNMWEIQLNWSTSDELRNWRCNYETGGARQSAVAAQPMHVGRICQLKSGFKYPDHSKKCPF